MRNFKKILVSILAVLMLLTVAPMSGIAKLDFNWLDFSTRSSALEDSGSCGTNVTYTFDSAAGLLTISGTGEMNSLLFKEDSTIKTVVIEYGVTGIGEYAFCKCTGLSSIAIPNSISSIGAGAFQDCTNLNDIELHDNITFIDTNAFNNTGFYNNTENWNDNGLYINNYLIKVKSDLCENFTIKDGTKVIAGSAFTCVAYKENVITSVSIPNSVITIGPWAFYGCTNLTEISIPNNVSYIGYDAFEGCSKLNSITIPDSVTHLGNFAFQCCSNLTSVVIPNTITEWGQGVFMQCDKLTDVNIPTNISTIPESMFGSCVSLESVTIPNNITEIGSYVFSGCEALSNIIIPNTVTKIDDGVFSSCIGLEEIALPDKLEKIGDYAFGDCTSLSQIEFPTSLKSVGSMAFCRCSSLEQVIIPNGVNYIGESAFSECTGLISLTIPATINSDISQILTPMNSQNYIEEGSIKVYYDGTFEQWLKIYTADEMNFDLYYNSDTYLGFYYDIYDNEATIDVGSELLKEVTALNFPEYIGKYPIRTVIFSVDSRVTTYQVKQLNIPKTVRNVDVMSGYLGILPLEKITVDDENPYLDSRNDCNAIIDTDTDTLILGCKNTVIPKTVKIIQAGAFREVKGLTKITIPTGVTEIGWGAFCDAKDLVSIILPKSVKEIGTYSFNGSGLTTVYYTGTQDDKKSIHFDTDGITPNINAGILNATWIYESPDHEHIYENGFCTLCGDGLEWEYTENGNTVTLTKYIGSQSDITIPSTVMSKTVTAIGTSAFAGNNSIKYVYIPNGVETIGESAFENCTSLKEVFIGNTVKSIGQNAFAHCKKLALVCTTSENLSFNNSFSDNDSRLNLIVPDSSSTANNIKNLSVKYNTFLVSNKKDDKRTIIFNGDTTLYQNLDYNYWIELINIYPNASYLYFDKLTFDGIEQDTEIQLGADGHIVSDTQSFTLERIYIGARVGGRQITFSDLVDYLNGNDRSTQIFFVDDEQKEKTVFEKIGEFFTSALNAFSRAINRIVRLFKKNK